MIAMDVYHSRDVTTPELIDRQDPVVYCDHEPSPLGMLSEAQVREFDENGFLFFPSLLSAEDVQKYRAELERLRLSEAIKKREETILEPRDNQVRSVFAVHKLSPVLAELAADGRLLDVVTHLLGSRVYLHQTRINYKSGFVGKEFYWHSDFETWHMEDGMPRMRAISCSVALTENNEFNGPLMVIPGSHKTYLRCVGETPEENYKQSLRRQEVGTPDNDSLTKMVERGGIVAPKGPAGSVLFFDCNLMHGSNSNISPYPRSNVFMVYNSLENTLVKPFCGLAPRPEHIGHRDFKGL